MAEPLVIETQGLCKRYGARQGGSQGGIDALRGLDLEVPAGSICGFLGRNGAGKTTTIKLLLGMAHASGGHARVFGLPAGDERASVAIRRRTGFVSDDKDLYDYMDVAALIRFTAGFFPRWRADLATDYLRRFELPLDRKVKSLSRGMRTKLALLVALCRGAELLILDEPTAGLDPAMAEQVLQALVAHVAREATTVFFSSHQIAEVEQIADRIAILERGRAVLSGALDDLRARFRRIQLVFDRDPPDLVLRSPVVGRVRRQGRVISVVTSAGADPILDEVRALGAVSIDVSPVGLKEIFLETVAAED
ncbi:MAG TPA: ABC transporter ATP-binding protein [Kofleriaceae bacterium]|nr:ABC transporter ATP-binding protein [Kofleriaceae bacterium]